MAAPRPDRLVHRLKSITLDDASAPKLVVVRQPKGPDNTKVNAIDQPVSLTAGEYSSAIALTCI